MIRTHTPTGMGSLETAPGRRTPEQRRLAELAEPLLKLEWNELVDALSPADRERRGSLRRRLHELEVRKPPPLARAWTIAENGTERSAHILKRGNPHQKGRRVTPGFPEALRGPGDPAPRDRVALASWLTRAWMSISQLRA